jgi:hypothetical protein
MQVLNNYIILAQKTLKGDSLYNSNFMRLSVCYDIRNFPRSQCVYCENDTRLMVIPDHVNKLICHECFELFVNELESPDAAWKFEEIKLEDNFICNLCYLYPPSYFNIAENPIKRVCAPCASLTTKLGTKTFVSMKWKGMINSFEDVGKYKHFKEHLKTLKKDFSDFASIPDLFKKKINDFKTELKKQVDLMFDYHVNQHKLYKQSLTKNMNTVLYHTKNSILTGKKNYYQKFLESNYRQEFFQQELSHLKFLEDEDMLHEVFDEFFNLKTLGVDKIIPENWSNSIRK